MPLPGKNNLTDAGLAVEIAPGLQHIKSPKAFTSKAKNRPVTIMQSTPKSLRLHIGIFGRRNVGKSSVLNAITQQNVSIVSAVAGTTTDPVEKPMELLPIGPVLFLDTAGIDDIGDLGQLRMDKTRKVIERAEIALLVVGSAAWGEFEAALLAEFQRRQIPVIVVFNKSDLGQPYPEITQQLAAAKLRMVHTSAATGSGMLELRQALIETVPEEFLMPPALLADLVPPGQMAILVVPIDMEAPKGRLIMPQVQSIRDLLDNDAYCMVVKERELRDALDQLKRPPALIVTDSQAFLKVDADTPAEIPLTSFSILFARFKGDLDEFVRGAAAIDRLSSGSRVLIAEACSHHPIGEDIGTVKIPRWLRQYVGGKLEFTHIRGHDFPADLRGYDLVIHCGGCMWNRRQMLSRLLQCREAGVAITNYGVAIAACLGILPRALTPFPSALAQLKTLN